MRYFLLAALFFSACSQANPHEIGHDHETHAAHSHAEDAETRTVSETATQEKARAYFTDTVLIRHDGEEQRFYTDVLAGNTVVISFIFTSCPDACPLINAQIRKLQSEVGDRLGDDIHFVSISVDPLTDTADVLSEYRQRFGAKDGWWFFTGEPDAVETVSHKLGNVFETKEQHSTTLLVGNLETARWRKIPSHLPSNVIGAQVLDIANEKLD